MVKNGDSISYHLGLIPFDVKHKNQRFSWSMVPDSTNKRGKLPTLYDSLFN